MRSYIENEEVVIRMSIDEAELFAKRMAESLGFPDDELELVRKELYAS